MADDFSVSISAKRPHRHSPFDDILTLEKEQETRMRTEKEALEAAEKQESNVLRETEQKRLEEKRVHARAEFERYKTQELPDQLKAAEKASTEERTRIVKAAGSKKKAVVDTLVEKMLSSDILTRL